MSDNSNSRKRKRGMKPAMLEIAANDGTTYRVYDLEAAAERSRRRKAPLTRLSTGYECRAAASSCPHPVPQSPRRISK